MEKVNKHILRTLGEILHEQAEVPPDVLVTVSQVETTRNLRAAHVWLYISPDSRAEEVLELLTGQLYDLQGELNRQLNLRPLPRLYLHIDHGADHAEHVARKLDELENDQR